MIAVAVVPCRLAHLRAVAADLRAEERAELAALGLKPRHALMQCWRETPGSLAALVDGRPAAVWGDAGALLDPVGKAWLFTTKGVELVPLVFLKTARAWINHRLVVRRVLRSHVADAHAQALRFYRLLGFWIGPPEARPPGGALFREIRIEAA